MNPDRVPIFLSKVNGSSSKMCMPFGGKCLNLFDDIDLLSFRQSGAIEEWFDGESRNDAE
jgi:hypothetical protein